jgi:hypothetical protein
MNAENTTQPDAGEPLFSHLVAMFSTSALQQLGKLRHPGSGRTEIDLEGAQFAIDMLEMLERKTQGRLSREESRALADTLTMLRLNYVETARSVPASDGQKEPSGPIESPSATAAAAPEPAAAGEAPQKEAKSPKFHKTYE